MPTRNSSFDPMALVKAMGQQRDPFSWAQQYGQDALKMQMFEEQQAQQEALRQDALMEKIQARTERGEQRKEEEAGRDRRAKLAQDGANKRASMRGAGSAAQSKLAELERYSQIPGIEIIPKQSVVIRAMREKGFHQKYMPIAGGDFYVPRDAAGKAPAAPAQQRQVEPDEESFEVIE